MRTGTSRAGSKAEGGFTLLELLVVFVVIGLVIAIVPRFSTGPIEAVRISSAARTLAADLKVTRDWARIHNQPAALLVSPDGQQYKSAGRPAGRVLPDGVVLAMEGRRAGSASGVEFFPAGGASGGTFRLVSSARSRLVAVEPLMGRISILGE